MTSIGRSAAVGMMLFVAACSGHPPNSVVLSVGPMTALYDTPLSVSVSGLSAGRPVQLRATSTDAHGVEWSATATFTASAQGRAGTDQAAIAGSYTGVDPMGLIENLVPPGSPAPEEIFTPPPDWKITVSVVVDVHTAARATVTRQLALANGATETELRPPNGSVYGNLFLPADTSRPRPAVVVFGGSEGGLSMDVQAATLAAHGYPALSLAYFDEPGLPKHLDRIPLEYFLAAVDRLAGSPGVDAKQILAWGVSRGSEAAQLLGADFPDRVHGVIATVPSADAGPAIDNVANPAWTLGGRAVPYVEDDLVGDSFDTTTPPANIAIEHITGPIVLVCGTHDEVWPSCPWTTAITTRLAAHHARAATVVRAADAGHLVGTLLAYLPDTNTSFLTADGIRDIAGGAPAADARGRADGWSAVLAALKTLT